MSSSPPPASIGSTPYGWQPKEEAPMHAAVQVGFAAWVLVRQPQIGALPETRGIRHEIEGNP